jgi:hypothetical protein
MADVKVAVKLLTLGPSIPHKEARSSLNSMVRLFNGLTDLRERDAYTYGPLLRTGLAHDEQVTNLPK